MNPIVVLLRNNLHLSRAAIKSFRAQDIDGGVEVMAVDNQSTDGTPEWLKTQRDLLVIRNDPPKSVAASWNQALRYWFINRDAKYVLVLNNDTIVRPDTYRHLVNDGSGFVTAVGTNDPEKIKKQKFGDGDGYLAYAEPNPERRRPHPDFSCFLIRREVFEKVGPFDENFLVAFCEDSDYDCRMYQAGIRASSIDLPFLHYGSRTIKNADDVEARKIALQAGRNREYFKRKWGFEVGSEAYYRFLNKWGPDAPPSSPSSASSPASSDSEPSASE